MAAAKWTFMVYMAGNNSLSDDAGVDLREMRRQGSTSDLNVLAFIKQEGSNARRFKVEKGGHESIDDLGPGVDSGDPNTVVEFIRWAVRKAPAQRYALVLWNHGGGWRADDLEQLYTTVRGAPGISRHELNKRGSQRVSRVLFSSTVRQILALPADDREILADDTTGHSLDTLELQRVLQACNREIGHSLDLLGMDACLMTALEVAYQLRREAGMIVGSEEEEPSAGWPYTKILGDLAANPDMSSKDLASLIVKTYVGSYQRAREVVTQCALDPAQLDGLSAAVDRLERALRPALGTSWQELVRAQARSVHFAFDLIDLKTLCTGLAASGLDQQAKAAAAEVVDKLKLGGVVTAEGHLGKKVERCGGVSVYFPSPTTAISRYYKDLEFAKRHRWDELLRGYHEAVASA